MCKYIEHYSNKSCTKNIRGKKMKFKEAEQIIANIVESAALNARDVDEDQAKEIDEATTIYFDRVDKLIKEDDKKYDKIY